MNLSRFVLIIGPALSATMLGCSSGSSAGLASITVSTGQLVPAFDPEVTNYTVTSLNSVYPIEVTATTSDPLVPIVIHGSWATSGTAASFRLQPKEDFTVVAGGRTYTIHYVPTDLPQYSVTKPGSGAGTEYVLLSVGAYVLMIDRAGAPVYYRNFAPKQVEDFQQHKLADGTVYYSTLVGAFDVAWTLGVDHVMDSRFRDVTDVQLVPNASHEVLPAEGHDFMLLGDEHYVSMSYVQRVVDMSKVNPSWSTKATVMYAVVQEIDHGKAVFEWDSENVPSLYLDSTSGASFGSTGISDYLHMNSMDVDPADGNFVFSFRYADSVVKIDRKNGQILWTLGGKEDQFGLTAAQKFSWQHFARVEPDGSLMIFDNGNNAHQTRIVRFVLDEANKRVTSFTDVYDKPTTEPQTTYMGSHAQLGASRYLFGWGGWNDGSIWPAATEVVNGSVVWSMTFKQKGIYSYRALPISAL
jgi:hypothetical protein